MDELQPTPSKITKSCSTLQRLLQEIDAEIVQFTNSPIDTPSLDLLAQRIQKKFFFIRNLLNAEIASHGVRPDDSMKIKEKITQLEAKFHRSNLQPVNVCESCLNDDSVDESSGFEAPEMLYGVVVPPPAVVFESMMLPSNREKVETLERSGGGKRRRTVAVTATVIVALMVSFFDYMVGNQHEEFLIPT